MKSIKIKNFVDNRYVKLTYEGLPKNLFKFLLIIMSSIGLLSSIGREAQALKTLKYVVRLPLPFASWVNLGRKPFLVL